MGWSQMADDDLKAVAKFVKALPPVKNKVPADTFKPNMGPPGGAPPAGSGGAPADGSAAPAAGSAAPAAGSAK
jgi:hypothetical protein